MDRQPPTPKLPYYPRFVQDWASSPKVRAMRTFAERGLYSELLDLQWQEGSLPAEPEACHEALGVGTSDEFGAAWARVERCFPIGKDGRRRNPRLEFERAKALRLVEVRRSAGKQRSSKSADKQELPASAEQTLSNAQQTSSNALLSEIEIEKERKRGSSLGIDLPGDLEFSLKLHPLVADATSPEGRNGNRGKRRKRRVIEYTPGFLAAYQAYPIKIAKEEAFQEWNELLPAPVVDQVVGGVLAWAASRKWREEPDKIPYFKKFLHRRQWEQRPPGVVGENWQAAFNAKGEELKK